MMEIRVHSKGGQGAVQANRMLCRSIVQAGGYAQFIPAFGVERKGSPVFGFFRVSDAPIRVNSQVYSPDLVVIMDESLLGAVDVYAGLKPGGRVLVNTKRRPDQLGLPDDVSSVGVLDAFGIAGEVLGRSIPNTTLLGAIAAFVPGVDRERLFGLIGAKFGEANVRAAQRGAEELRVHPWAESAKEAE
ncbi:2-oxoacid:acceptor oxidoreductase family protein [Pseudodesulfovibrio methanolicus]|uniref:2-oxoacid:acceptor oxidoreductase family protein n=1 Tax=Pseudodesulfovibrio methanolicus TaxID=3126690 RepID=A0ABZ2J2V5_9BACT